MPCYRPLRGWPGPVNENNKRPLVFKKPKGASDDEAIERPCGGCIGCRLDQSRAWATRCMHEASMNEKNCFITLTYRPENTPEFGNLNYSDFQAFLKRLRDKTNYKPIKFYMCGEYGENLEHSKNGRFGHPHYHACIFGHDYKDKEPIRTNKNGDTLYKSQELADQWKLGHVTVGEVTYQSAAYVARYVMKKQKGKSVKEIQANGLRAYEFIDPNTGEIKSINPEFTRMSTGGRKKTGGIGKSWYDKNKQDIRKGYITSRGKKMKIPQYYERQLEKEDPEKVELMKLDRAEKARISRTRDIVERRLDAEKIKQHQTKNLVRNKI
jgi:hypothetical protein